MKEVNPIQPITPRIVGDHEDVMHIVSEDQQHIYLKEYLSVYTLKRKMDVIMTYFDNGFSSEMSPKLFRATSCTFSYLLQEMNEMVLAMDAIERAKL